MEDSNSEDEGDVGEVRGSPTLRPLPCLGKEVLPMGASTRPAHSSTFSPARPLGEPTSTAVGVCAVDNIISAALPTLPSPVPLTTSPADHAVCHSKICDPGRTAPATPSCQVGRHSQRLPAPLPLSPFHVGQLGSLELQGPPHGQPRYPASSVSH